MLIAREKLTTKVTSFLAIQLDSNKATARAVNVAHKTPPFIFTNWQTK